MEISGLKDLLDNISYYLSQSSFESIDSEPALKYFQRVDDILKVLRPVLDAIVDSEVASNELLTKAFEELGLSVDELRDLFESWHPLKSKVFFVLQIESLMSKIQSSSLGIFKVLDSINQCLPEELTSTSLEKIKHTGYEQTSGVIKETIMDQVEGTSPKSESLEEIADCLKLKSNQEILIEAVALEKLKENAEQSENGVEAEFINQMIGLVTHMHDCYILMHQSQSCSPVPIPPDFCCPLSLELMTDPVIVSSGQTYERMFIKNWIDHGLNVCPKTRQTLAHNNLIPNYTVKALIANWCESNNVKLPEPVLSMKFTPSSPLHSRAETAHKDSHIVPQSSSNQPMSPESTHSIGLSETGINVSGEIPLGKTGPSHPRSSSGGSLSGIVGNGNGLDIGRLSLMSSEVTNPEERSIDSSSQQVSMQSRLEFSEANGDDEHLSHGHNRSSSSSSSLSNVNASQSIPGDINETSHASAYSSDASGEVMIEPLAVSLPSLLRESELIPRVETRTRNQTIWRRPSERFAPRIVSTPAIETRPDLSAIEAEVRKLIEDLNNNTSLDVQRDAIGKLRLLAKHNMDNRIAIANCGAISVLVDLLRSTDSKIQENAVTALLNLSINDNNKTVIANAEAIEPLILVLKEGSPEAKENSAATLFSLSVMEENKSRIGRSGAIPPLVDLLGNGTPRGKKDAATALFNLSIFHENKARILQAGAVKYLVELMDPAAGMVDKAVAVLSNLATIPEGRAAIGQGGGIPVLVEVVELGSARGKENAAAALLQLCSNSSRFCSMVLQEGAVPPLVALSQTGTPRAKEKALGLLSCFRNHRHGNAGRG